VGDVDVTKRRPPPRHEAELMVRANALLGRSLGEIAAALGIEVAAAAGRHTKGLAGDLIERALGASAGSQAEPDFPALGIELKTIPIDARGRVRESTFVCAIQLGRIGEEAWATSWVRRKLACVLWIPVEAVPDVPLVDRRIGRAILWRPSAAEEEALAADYDELAGRIGVGGVEEVTAHAGRWLQVRPKGADGSVRTEAFGPDGEAIEAVPRGFYLRAEFTAALLAAGSGAS
jgi:DNA mismatch repair protein MutH